MGKKKKRPKKSSFASASSEIGEKRKKHQKQGPYGSESEEKEEEKKCCRGAFLINDPAAEEKKKRKCQNQAPLNSSQHLDSVDQTGTSGCMYVWEREGEQLILCIYNRLPTTGRFGVRQQEVLSSRPQSSILA